MTPKKKIPPPRTVSLIYVRNLDKEDNDMLNALKALTGFGKSNATNVMRASYKLLDVLKEIKILKEQIRKLEQSNSKKDEVYRSIKSEILSIMEKEIKLTKTVAQQKIQFYRAMKKTGRKIPKSLNFSSSREYFFD